VLRQRVELEADGFRLVALDARRGLEPVYQAAGLEAPWLVMGPVKPGGLLRELANPLGFTPGSAVFGERSGLRLETSLSGTSRRGLQLAPLPDFLGLYAVRSCAEPFTVGGLLRLPLGRVGEAEALAQVALPALAAKTEDWFASEPPYPGGPLLHLAGRIGLQPPADLRESAGLVLSWAAALCSGPRVPPGLYSRLIAGLEGRRAAGEALLGVCTQDYRVSEGTGSDQGTQVACRVRLGPRTGTRLEADWNRLVGRPARGLAAAAGYLPGSERWSLRLQLEAECIRARRVRLEAAGELGRQWATDGVAQHDAGAALELRLESRRREGVLGVRGAWKGDGGGNHLQGYASCRWDGLRVEGGLELDSASPREPQFFGALQLMGRRQSFIIRAGGSPAQPPEVTLGWSAAQELPKSPTSRTSRSSCQP
jgi:hypothetical protein